MTRENLSGHTRSSIASLLLRSDAAVERAMVVLYDRQTRDEKADSDTRHQNQRGFSCAHARRGTYYARWLLGGRHLTGAHLGKARAMALRYTRQLLDEAEHKASRSAEVEYARAVRRPPETVCPRCGCPKVLDERCCS